VGAAPSDPGAILDFWFAGAADDPDRAAGRGAFWFGASADVDRQIGARFAQACAAAAAGGLDHWAAEPRAALARILLLDQFPRNLYRATARAFATDAKALRATRALVAAGHLAALTPVEQAFALMPYQHAESLPDQREGVALFERAAATAPRPWAEVMESYAGFARRHLQIIERFGRFPHRNRVLNRASTPAEEQFMAAGGESFGQAPQELEH